MSGPAPWGRVIAAWLVLIAIEVVHGILRALLLAPHVGTFRANQIGVFTGSILILIAAYFLAPWMGIRGTWAMFAAGVVWVILTVAFEFGFGHFAMGRAWQSLAADYDIPHGGLMPFGLLVMACSPFAASRLRSLWG